MWNRYRQTAEFAQPWLLRFFDQIRFYEVSHDELQTIRTEFPRGQYPLKIEEGEFRLADYEALINDNADSISAFREHRQNAFDEELERWHRDGHSVAGFQQRAADNAIARRLHRDLHLHGLQHQQGLPGLNNRALFHFDLPDAAGHRAVDDGGVFRPDFFSGFSGAGAVRWCREPYAAGTRQPRQRG